MIEKNQLYSKRKSFSRSIKFNKAFLESFKNALAAGGFSQVVFRLPHNILSEKENDVISYDDFLKRERNYPSVILIAINPKTDETVKVLFVNISTKTFFKDNTFPSGHSEPSELYIQSTPDRLYSLFEFYYNRFFTVTDPRSVMVEPLLGILSLFVLLYYFASMLMNKPAYFSSIYHAALLDYLSMALSIIFLFIFLNRQTGLYVKEKEFKPTVWFKMAIRGEFRDNPIVNLVVGITGGFIVVLLAHILGW